MAWLIGRHLKIDTQKEQEIRSLPPKPRHRNRTTIRHPGPRRPSDSGPAPAGPIRVRPQFEAALAAARQVKAHAPHCRVIFTVYEMKRLGRDAAARTASQSKGSSPT